MNQRNRSGARGCKSNARSSRLLETPRTLCMEPPGCISDQHRADKFQCPGIVVLPRRTEFARGPARRKRDQADNDYYVDPSRDLFHCELRGTKSHGSRLDRKGPFERASLSFKTSNDTRRSDATSIARAVYPQSSPPQADNFSRTFSSSFFVALMPSASEILPPSHSMPT
jgi:hypothetical protein